MIKKYIQFIKEADEVNPTGEAQKTETDAGDSSKFAEIIDEVKSMIEKTIEKSGGEFDSFVKSYINNPNYVNVEVFLKYSYIYYF